MKQKQLKTPTRAAKQTKAVKATPAKVVQKVVEESDEEEEVVQKVVVKKTIKKKPGKAKKIVEEPVVEEPEVEEPEVEEAEDEPVEEESDEDEPEEQENEEEEEVEEEGDEDEDDGEENDGEENDGEENDGEEEEVEEDAESSDECAKPTDILHGPLKNDYENDQCIHVSKLPKKCLQLDVVEAFAKYGKIKQIHIVTTPNGTSADIAFKTAKAAAAAIADEVKIGDNVVTVAKRESKAMKKEQNRERGVYIRNIQNGTTEEQLRKLFEPCGEIEYVKLVSIKGGFTAIAFVTFTDKSSVPAALKLHNTVLNDSNIKVSENTENKETRKRGQFDENVTIMVKNKQEFNSIDVTKLESIFSKCGEIENLDLVCKKNILAFIAFKTEEAAKKALKLNGKTQQDIILELEPYTPLKKLTTIHVVNVPKNCTIEDLKTHFSKAGEISNVTLKGNFAIIRFEDSDGFCKSFLFNESFIKGNMIFIEPFSNRKAVLMRNFARKKGTKRPFENGRSAFKPKKSKIN